MRVVAIIWLLVLAAANLGAQSTDSLPGTGSTATDPEPPAPSGDTIPEGPATTARTLPDLLHGRHALLSVIRASGATGAGAAIRFLDTDVVATHGRPLVFLDGIRITEDVLGPYAFAGLAGALDRLADLDPAAVERVEVVRGSEAVSRYGADAQEGAILLWTREPGGEAILRQRASLAAGTTRYGWTPPDNYGPCPADGVGETAPIPACRGQDPGTIVADNPLLREDRLGPGSLLAARWDGYGSHGRLGYSAGIAHMDEAGQLPWDALRRTGVRAALAVDVGRGVDLLARLHRSETRHRPPDELNVLGNGLFGSPERTSTRGWADWLPEDREALAAEAYGDRTLLAAALRHRLFGWLEHQLLWSDERMALAMGRLNASSTDPTAVVGTRLLEETIERGSFAYRASVDLARTLPAAWAGELRGGIRVERSVLASATRFRSDQGPTDAQTWRIKRPVRVTTGGVSLAAPVGTRLDADAAWTRDDFADRSAFGWSARAAYAPRGFPNLSVHARIGASTAPRAGAYPLCPPLAGPTGYSRPPCGFEWHRRDLEGAVRWDLPTELIGEARAFLVRNTYARLDDGDEMLRTRTPGVAAMGTWTVARRPALVWELDGMAARVWPRVEESGYPPFVHADFVMIAAGTETGALHGRPLVRVDTVAGVAVIGETWEPVGAGLPTLELTAGTRISLRAATLRLRVGGAFGGHTVDYAGWVRDRVAPAAAFEGVPEAERLRRQGPYVVEKREPAPDPGAALHIYPSDHVRLRELALTWVVPPALATRFRVRSAALTLAGADLWTWTRYSGIEPEMAHPDDPLLRSDWLTPPRGRQLIARIEVGF